MCIRSSTSSQSSLHTACMLLAARHSLVVRWQRHEQMAGGSTVSCTTHMCILHCCMRASAVHVARSPAVHSIMCVALPLFSEVHAVSSLCECSRRVANCTGFGAMQWVSVFHLCACVSARNRARVRSLCDRICVMLPCILHCNYSNTVVVHTRSSTTHASVACVCVQCS